MCMFANVKSDKSETQSEHNSDKWYSVNVSSKQQQDDCSGILFTPVKCQGQTVHSSSRETKEFSVGYCTALQI